MLKNMKLSAMLIALFLVVTAMTATFASASEDYTESDYLAGAKEAKLSPATTVSFLKQGNLRFVSGKSIQPHLSAARLTQAGKENQGNHAYATIITCSDSRVPVEHIFDAGVMDTFIIRVAGNVCDTDEVGSIEYGLAHVNTPVLVVLGHTQCGAVTAVTHAINGTGHALEYNIPPLVDNIQPAVKRAQRLYPNAKGDSVIPYAIEENVWQGIEDLFMRSASTRELVRSGKAKVVGAIYDVGTGKVKWLNENKTAQILAKVDANPSRIMTAMAGGGHDKPVGGGHAAAPAASHGGGHDAAPAVSHGSGHVAAPAVSHGSANAGHGTTIEAEKVTLVSASRLTELDNARHAKNEAVTASITSDTSGLSSTWKLILGLVILLGVAGAVWKSGTFSRMGVTGKLYSGFATVVLLALGIGVGGFYFLGTVSDETHLETAAMEMDMMSGEIGTLQNEFVLVGIEDKARGEEILTQHKNLTEEFVTDIAAIREMHLTEGQAKATDHLEKATREYAESFEELTEKYHEIEELKEELDELGEKAEEQIAHVLHEHESDLVKLENSGVSMQVIAQQTELISLLAKCEVLVLKLSHEEVEFLLDKHIDRVAKMEAELGMLRATLKAVRPMVIKAATSDEEKTADRKTLAKLDEELDAYEKALAKVIVDELVVAGDMVECNHELDQIDAWAAALSESAAQSVVVTKADANLISVALMIIAAVLGSALAVFITRGITKPINQIVLGLTAGAEQTSSASGQVSSASQSLAQGASEAAAAVEETTSSIEEMSSMIRQNAASADEARTLAATAQSDAEKGTAAMTRMSDAINDIKKSSDETAKIIKTIDEIAFQTNLLALNAAVEAARAGEAGKGFAVVAEEVRNLAQRSAEAARNTADMIEESVKNAENGVSISKEVAESLEEIAGGAGKVNDLVSEIAAANNEQAQGAEQISTAIGQMDQVTQGNAANAEESASAAEELTAQAEELNNMVSQLQALIGGSGSTHTQSRSFQADHAPAERQVSRTSRTASNKSVASAEKTIPLDSKELANF